MHIKRNYKFKKKLLLNIIELLFNKMKENNIKCLNRIIYKYICMKKLINIFFQNNHFIKISFTVYFEFIEGK